MKAGNETKVVGLYLVPGVDEQFEFFSLTQGEVYQFAWFRISDLMNQMKKEKPVYIDGKAAKFVQVRLLHECQIAFSVGALRKVYPFAPHQPGILRSIVH